MNMSRARISIVVLTYNRARLLEDCLESLFAQSHPRELLEIVVSDDGSRDGTRHLVERLQTRHPHLKYTYHPHRGVAAARNRGIALATGEIIAIVADDYILDPDYAARIARFFQEYPQAEVVRFKVVAAGKDLASRISHFYFDVSVRRRLSPEGVTAARSWREALRQAWRKAPPLVETLTTEHQLEAAGAAAFRRHVFARAGLFDESLLRAEDTDMTKRLRALGVKVYYDPLHHIRHQYHPLLLDTLSKCFRTGYNRFHLYRKHGFPGAEGAAGPTRRLISRKLRMILEAVWRARQAESLPRVVFYLPFMLLFEVANKTGFVCATVVERLRRRTPGRPIPAPAAEERPGAAHQREDGAS